LTQIAISSDCSQKYVPTSPEYTHTLSASSHNNSYRLGLLRVLLRYCGKTIVLSLDNVGAHGFIYA